MSQLRRNFPINLAALCTLAQIVLAERVDNGPFPALRYLAPLVGLLALMLIAWPIFALRQYGDPVPRASYMETTQIVDSGPYALVRHPQYLGYIFLNVTFILAGRHWLVLLLGASAMALFTLQARLEERHLLREFGPAYEIYMRRVPRFNLIVGLVRATSRRRRTRR